MRPIDELLHHLEDIAAAAAGAASRTSGTLRGKNRWLGLEVPLVSTIPVRDVAQGLARLQRSGGRIAVRVADGF